MNRAEIIHRAASISLKSATAEELKKYFYEEIKHTLENLPDEQLLYTIKEYFPSVVQFIKEDEEDD